jgi:hypothetical protein
MAPAAASERTNEPAAEGQGSDRGGANRGALDAAATLFECRLRALERLGSRQQVEGQEHHGKQRKNDEETHTNHACACSRAPGKAVKDIRKARRCKVSCQLASRGHPSYHSAGLKPALAMGFARGSQERRLGGEEIPESPPCHPQGTNRLRNCNPPRKYCHPLNCDATRKQDAQSSAKGRNARLDSASPAGIPSTRKLAAHRLRSGSCVNHLTSQRCAHEKSIDTL